jgi:P-type Cu2+ transporter
VDTIVFDKTGTLTRDAMVLADTQVQTGYSKERVLEMAAALARHSLHPVSRSLVQAYQSAAATTTTTTTTKETIAQCDAVAEFSGQGVEGKIGTRTLRLGSSRFCDVAGSTSATNAEGMSLVYLSDNESGWIATFALQEAMRPHVAEVIAALQGDGVKVMVLSGDRQESVAQLAARAGIAQFQAECSPDDKLAVMRSLQAKGQCVAMVGDGLNDGPVLAGADVSFAFGLGVPLAHAKADFVILGEQLFSVIQALRLSRRTLRIVRQNLWWALVYNVACVPLAIAGLLPAWLAGLGMASSSLLVVLNAMRLARLAHAEKIK